MESIEIQNKTNTVKYSYMSGAGNTFYMIDNRENIIIEKSEITKQLCNSDKYLNADGAIFIENKSEADFEMHYYNSDGSFGMMCGNGGRCAIRFVLQNNISNNNNLKFYAGSDLYFGEVIGNEIQLKLNPATNLILNQNINLQNLNLKYNFVDTGAPHVVIFLDENINILSNQLEEIGVNKIGREIRYHNIFANGTNVNFCKVIDKSTIKIRTYERGVEKETLACGTGSSASVVIAHKLGFVENECSVLVKSGEKLKIILSADTDSIMLQGSAHTISIGSINIDPKYQKVFSILNI
ncbi:MAG: diaminopimelate epimerase [Bacteroidetes bacterium]|nr:diaminopimelate epimerase [Bacteroidota bacterium]